MTRLLTALAALLMLSCHDPEPEPTAEQIIDQAICDASLDCADACAQSSCSPVCYPVLADLPLDCLEDMEMACGALPACLK